jgi:hypothetical protein
MLSDVVFIKTLFQIVTNFFVVSILGLFFSFQGRKTNTKLLFYYGLGLFGIGIALGLGTFIDFITVLITGNNMDVYLKLYLTWAPIPFVGVILGYVYSEILIPNNKWYFFSLILTQNTLYLLDLFIFHWTTDVIVYPAIPGEALVNTLHALPIYPFYSFRSGWFPRSLYLIIGIGMLYKAFGSKGIFRKKFFYLSTSVILNSLVRLIGWHLYPVWQLYPVLGDIASIFFTIIDFTSYIFAYLGLRAEPEQRKKRVKKKITTKDSLFRIIQKPEQITEEEVAFYREQKICLVCKGKVAGFNIFLCPNCEALYHEDCARVLTTMENACWVCIEPIDKTKSTKPFKKVEEKKDVKNKNKENNSKLNNKGS